MDTAKHVVGQKCRHIRLLDDVCLSFARSFKDLRVQIYNFFLSLQLESNQQPSVYKTDALPFELKRLMSELGEGFGPSNVGFADRYVNHFATRAGAGAERFELPSVVLETTMLPLHQTPVSAEDVGFEPTRPFRAFRFSGPVPSTSSANLPFPWSG